MKKNFLKKKIVKVLASAEFYDLDTQQWEMVGSMQVIRMMNTKVKEREKLTKRKIKEILSTTITKAIFLGGQNRACDQPGVRLAYGDRRGQWGPVHILHIAGFVLDVYMLLLLLVISLLVVMLALLLMVMEQLTTFIGSGR